MRSAHNEVSHLKAHRRVLCDFLKKIIHNTSNAYHQVFSPAKYTGVIDYKTIDISITF